jgi:hypothetical protein
VLVTPLYPPAAAFEQPVGGPYKLSLEDASLAELMNVPAAWDIVTKHFPSVKLVTSMPMMKPHLRNLTVRTLSTFVPNGSAEVYAAVDRELSLLPPITAPVE